MALMNKTRKKEFYRLHTKNGWTFGVLADHFGISIIQVQKIYNSELSRQQQLPWPEFRQKLSVRAQNAILARFGFDETIFNTPEKIAAETDALELWRYKNVGKVTIAEIVAALMAAGYQLKPEWHIFTRG
jgi:hypothetical protein